MKTVWRFVLGIVVCMTYVSYAQAEVNREPFNDSFSVAIEPLAFAVGLPVVPGNDPPGAGFAALTLSFALPWKENTDARSLKLSVGTSYVAYGSGKQQDSAGTQIPRLQAMYGGFWEPGVEVPLNFRRTNYLLLAYLYGGASVGIRQSVDPHVPLQERNVDMRGIKIGYATRVIEGGSLIINCRLIETSHSLLRGFSLWSVGWQSHLF